MPTSDPTVLELVVERLTFGPDAIAHHDGRVVFVGPAAPGDRVRATVLESRGGWQRARVDAVLEAGPSRVVPACPDADRCGGCDWQHVAPDAQRDARRDVVAEQLARLGGLRDVPVLPTLSAGRDAGHRGHVTLVVEGRRLGYHAARSHRLVEVAHCRVADPAADAALPAARRWVAALRTVPIRVTLAAAEGGAVLVGRCRTAPGDADRAATEALLAAEPTLRGAVLAGGDRRLVVGDPAVRVVLDDDLALDVPADAFTQPNPGANRLLVRTVLAFARPAAGQQALDLYCGAGNFTLPLARRGVAVLGVEREGVALAAAEANAARLGIATARFRVGDVAGVLPTLPATPLDLIVLDPPRTGAADAIAAIAARRPRRILYVSCDPATLARDAKALAAHGFRCMRVQPVDAFPQTHHVESVAEFES